MSRFIEINKQWINCDYIATVTSESISGSDLKRYVFTDTHGKVAATTESESDYFESVITDNVLPAPPGFYGLDTALGDQFYAVPLVAFHVPDLNKRPYPPLCGVGVDGLRYHVIQCPNGQVCDGCMFADRTAYIDDCRKMEEHHRLAQEDKLSKATVEP